MLKIAIAYSIKSGGEGREHLSSDHIPEAGLSISPVQKRMPFKEYIDLPKVTSLYEMESDLEFRIVWLLRRLPCTIFFFKVWLGSHWLHQNDFR